ncbi:hypothetical protein GCM10022297_07830 [Lactobacillus hamsteri]|uniref:Rhamnogalacturonate lyase n=1 Tax=Lactobacillus hamsteri DSM 5661 = JCM 6256 TaxID=1423754 RepID=A0A0R1YE48_9LACO|nr:polysaccharide lyase family protein [Lactobacillus hamsteri]KRM40527.1 rhamnogalacturonate lyase [Lactobacillus hamsteri DSM 5661 = JCM 6256]
MEKNYLKLTVDKPNKIRMQNFYLDVWFNFHGFATSIKYLGKELLNNLQGEPCDPDKNHSFYCDYHLDGKTIRINPNNFKIIKADQELLHIVFTDNKNVLEIAYHFIMMKNDPVIYSFVKAKNNVHKEVKLDELRTVYRFNHKLFPIAFNGVRTGMQPTSKEMMQGTKLQDETYEMLKGSLYSNSKVYSKYDYAGYFKDTNFWGQFGDDLGVWIINTDTSYYGGGPLNQDLMVHYDGIVLNYLSSEHFGKGKFYISKDWQKLYGPWLIYFNNGSICDVKKRVEKEKHIFPYSWVKDSNYPISLGEVSGKLDLKTTSSIQYCMILASKKDIPVLEQHDGFTYYCLTDEKNKFMFKNIRPGEYYLSCYAQSGDDLENHQLGKVWVKSNQSQDLGIFQINNKNQTIWQIGQSDHTTKGFKFSNQLRNYMWMNLVPDNLSYHVGKKDDWYYLQNDKGVWNIYFNLDKHYLSKNLNLQFSFAGVTQKQMTKNDGEDIFIELNDRHLMKKHYENDRSGYRSSMLSGRYHFLNIEVPALYLKKHNKISISTNGLIMYDTIKLCKERH